MKPLPDPPDHESQGRARHFRRRKAMAGQAVRAVGNNPSASVDNRGAQGTDAPYPADESPGVPGFRTWRGIYLFVFLWFVIAVALLTLFSQWFA